MTTSTIETPDNGELPVPELGPLLPPPSPAPKHVPIEESVTRGAMALLSTQPLTWGASLLTTALAPRLLGADTLGQFTVVFTLMSLVGTAAGLGVSEFLVRRIAQRPASLQQDLGVALLLQTLTAILGVVVISLVAPYVAALSIDPRLLYIALFGMIVLPLQNVLLSSFRGREQHRQYAWFNAASGVIGQMLGILVLLAGGEVLAYAATLTLVTLVSTLVCWKLSGLRPTLPSLRDGSLLRAFREFTWGGFPFLTWALTMAVTSGIDRVLLGLFVPVAEVGWYAAAYRIYSIPVFIPTLIITPLFPALSRMVHDPETIRRMIAKTIRVVLLLTIPLSAGTIVIAPAIPGLLGWPADFDKAVPLISLLSLQLPFIAIDMVFGVVLMAIQRQGRWVVVGVVAAALKILVNFLAIPVFENLSGNGAVGASIVSLLSEAVMLVGAVILIPKPLLDVRVAWDGLRIGLAGAATVVVGAVLLPYALVLAIMGGALAYVVVSFALRVLTLDDFRLLQGRLLKAIPARVYGR